MYRQLTADPSAERHRRAYSDRPGGYTFRLDDAELSRFRAMAENAQRHEDRLWSRAGIGAGAAVIDLGCGPGALLPVLARRVGPTGSITAVDADPVACAAARHVATELGTSTEVVCADATDTDLAPGRADVIMCRNVLVHNGARAGALLSHAAALLRDGGHLVSAEPDVDGLDFGAARAEREYDRRWAALMRADGNDPALGRGDRLADLLRRQGWRVVDQLCWTDALVIDRSPAWAAADAIVGRGFATAAELADWQQALERRRAAGPLRCSLTMTAVLAVPPGGSQSR
ncbi:MAG: methyltransferase domain-containing protein [Jatrophihabitans sp.]|uniref:methyltransferase domain-containing protein n=1 Tax=Jatrophihabitans sp. TaxID=1932789 RepID=UPI003910C234